MSRLGDHWTHPVKALGHGIHTVVIKTHAVDQRLMFGQTKHARLRLPGWAKGVTVPTSTNQNRNGPAPAQPPRFCPTPPQDRSGFQHLA